MACRPVLALSTNHLDLLRAFCLCSLTVLAQNHQVGILLLRMYFCLFRNLCVFTWDQNRSIISSIWGSIQTPVPQGNLVPTPVLTDLSEADLPGGGGSRCKAGHKILCQASLFHPTAFRSARGPPPYVPGAPIQAGPSYQADRSAGPPVLPRLHTGQPGALLPLRPAASGSPRALAGTLLLCQNFSHSAKKHQFKAAEL